MPWLAQSPAASPTTVSPSPRPLPMESVEFEDSFPGASFMPWLAQMPGATATTMSSSPVLLHIWLTELEPPLFWCIIHAVTGAEPRSNPYDSSLLTPAFCLHTTWVGVHIGNEVSWHVVKRGFAVLVYQVLITGSAVLSQDPLDVSSGTSSHTMNMSSHCSRCTGQGVKAGQAAEGHWTHARPQQAAVGLGCRASAEVQEIGSLLCPGQWVAFHIVPALLW